MANDTPHSDVDIPAFKEQLQRCLEGFSSEWSDSRDYDLMQSTRLARKDFPVPELLLFALRNGLGWRSMGHGEKVRWTVLGQVGGEPIAFELQKFGLKMLRPVGEHAFDDQRVIGQLRGAIQITEKFLKPLTEHQIQHGELVIANRFAEFSSRYLFFREKADVAFRQAKRKRRQPKNRPEASGIEGLGSLLSAVLNHGLKQKQEGFFYSVAMVDCYFSAIEHRLALLRAFTGEPMSEGGFREFISMSWDKKLTEILGRKQSNKIRETIRDLRRIKERIRNPFAHGGFENDKGSLQVFIPTVGMLPANFTKFGESARFSLFPVEDQDHTECCYTFDEVDKLLSSGHLAGPHRILEAGVDPCYDRKSLSLYRTTISGGDDSIEAFLEYWGHIYEREANMDY
jgi:hypothetical protein